MPDWAISLVGVLIVAATAIAGQVKLFGRYSEQIDEQRETLTGEQGLVRQVNNLTISCTKLESSVSSLQAILCNGIIDRVKTLEIELAVLKDRIDRSS